MLTLENLSFGVQEERKEKEIIHDLTLTIGEHKFVVITGPNGGGKSTLAKLIAGIEKPIGSLSGGNKQKVLLARWLMMESDLLILDDIGTELANTFTVSRLFQILNERALRRKSTIVSTNLSPRDFRDIYSERVFSRITSSYTLVKFSGSDIRIRKKISGSR